MVITATVPAESFLSFDYAQARRLLLGERQAVSLVLVGCGGTGSWLAPSVVRVARLLGETFNRSVKTMFVDPDRVEAKNCYRQNFCEAEVGRYKADALAYRYGLAWGVDVTAATTTLADVNSVEHLGGLTVLIGCVDGPGGRRDLRERARRLRENGWWLDCGNFKSGGQVLLGTGAKAGDGLAIPGFCSWLPMPSVQHPELVEGDLTPSPSPERGGGPECLSCAEMAMQDSQGLVINQRIAAEASDYLVRMLLTRDLCKFATYIDLASGSSRSRYITSALIREFISS